MKTTCFVWCLTMCLVQLLQAQPLAQNQFLAYGSVPAWAGVASHWQSSVPKLHFYPPSQYPGHADFVSKGLKTGINFSQFKQRVMEYQSREYLPFFVYDLQQQPMQLQGATYHWILHIEDYSYTDSPAEMAATVLKMLHMMDAELAHLGKGALVLSKKATGQPNMRMAPKLEAAGYYSISITDLLNHAGGVQIQVLNAGKAFGYLRYVTAGEENNYLPQPNEIVVYEQLPKRLFPLSGIISLEPQHELSHINLLAKNRGTVNISIKELGTLPNAARLQGQLVQLVCERGKVMLSPGNLAQAERFWASQKKQLDVPTAATEHSAIAVLSQAQDPGNALKYIGSKAYNYHWLLTETNAYYNVRVPAALALPFAHYRGFMKSNGLDFLLNELLTNQNEYPREWRAKQLKNLRKKMEDAPLNKQLALQIKKACAEHLPTERIRLRSSTNCEDLPNFNGAGLYLSKGFDTADSYLKLAQKIKEVYASLWSLEAFEERSYFGMDHREVAMAILISPAYPTEYANGVLMSQPNPNGLSYLVNSQFANHSVSNPTGSATSELLVYSEEGKRTQIKSNSSIHPIFLDRDLAEAQQHLLQAAIKLHERFTQGYPNHGIDIEYKIVYEDEHYVVYLKQIRLIGHVLPE